uniref:RNA helicase n=1 Tax=Kwoniella mangrovensis TaxID=463800 RepID=N0E6R7_9TREE|nr:CNB00610p [Kwoniella mangrovensis]
MDESSNIPSWADQSGSDSVQSNKPKGPGSQWQALNVGPDMIRSLLLRKFKNPTPIQRASIPGALSTPPRDILAMARTGSGKTLGYLIPLLERIGSTHSPSTNPRALIMCPSRELAMQILTVGKDLARGMTKGKGKETENLRWALIMGGESMEGQFEKMSQSPDIVIATPGRFLHLLVEMQCDLRHLQMVIYDEADRLFEMGFDVQLREILSRLPSTRQNLLFSATLPSTVAEFAKAGLVNPLLIRLDTEHKVSPDLDLRFLSVKPTEKDAGLLVTLRDAIKIGSGSDKEDNQPQAIVFVSTKHHVDYVSELLKAAGYRTSHIYSSLDQIARQQQLHQFRKRFTDVLVVTDVAARGLDIPIMDHVINYDFPPGPRVFVHRVGRTARAGRKGTAWSLVTRDDWPYLYDLQTFLGSSRMGNDADMLKAFPQDSISENIEYILSGLDEVAPHLQDQREVMRKGQAMFERSRGKASAGSYRKAKSLGHLFSGSTFTLPIDPSLVDSRNLSTIAARNRLVASIAAYAPNETVLELGRRGETDNSILMQKRRKLVNSRKKIAAEDMSAVDDKSRSSDDKEDMSMAKSFRDPHFFMDHSQSGAASERGYSLQSGVSLPEALSATTLDMTADEGSNARAQKASQLSWDRKKRKFVKTTVGADNKKMIRSESGALLPATYSTGRYNIWKSKKRTTSSSDLQNSNNQGQVDKIRGRTVVDIPGAKTVPHGGTGLLSARAIRQQREQKLKRKEKSNRPSHQAKKR